MRLVGNEAMVKLTSATDTRIPVSISIEDTRLARVAACLCVYI